MADNKFILKFSGDTTELKNAVEKANSTINNFAKDVRGMAESVAAGFAVREIVGFGTELIKLAGQVDGVKEAFGRLKDSNEVLQQMRAATKGTVSDFNLMKAAVQASNFQIPIQQLGSLFQFAYERAKATGQSVDYLVESIILGIGRKSPLILDNLGISAVMLREKLKGISAEAATVGDVAKVVGDIATEELNKIGDSAATSAEKIARISTNIENIKVRAGKGLSIIFDPLIEGLNLLTGGEGDAKKNFDDMFAAIRGQGGVANNIQRIAEAAKKANIDLNTYVSKWASVNQQLNDYRALVSKAFIGPTQNQLALPAPPPVVTLPKKSTYQKITDPIQFPVEVKLDFESLQQTIANFNKEFIESVDITSLSEEIDPAIEALTNKLIATRQRMLEVSQQTNQIIEQNLEQMAVGFGQALGDIFSGIGDPSQFGAVLLQGVGQMAQQLGQLAIGVGIGVSGIKKALTSLNPAVAIAAGVALVALGKMATNRAASIASRSGGGGGIGGMASGGGGGVSGTRLESLGQRVQLVGNVQFDIAGDKLVGVLKNQDRFNSRTKTT